MMSGIRKHPIGVAAVTLAAVIVCFNFTSIDTLWHSTLQSLILGAVVLIAICLVDPRRFLFLPPITTAHAHALPWGALCATVAVAVLSVVAGAVASRFTTAPTDAAASSGLAWALLPELVVMCLGTALFEEGFFRGILFDALLADVYGMDSRSGACLKSAVVLSLIFGLLHVMGAWSYVDGVVTVLQIVLKPVGACLFGLVMTALYMRTRSISVVSVVHAVYDVIVLGPYILTFGTVQSNYINGSVSDLASMAVTVVCLIPLAVWAWRTILLESGEYVPMFSSHAEED